jgi:hypothetical protein
MPQTFCDIGVMSALPPKVDITQKTTLHPFITLIAPPRLRVWTARVNAGIFATAMDPAAIERSIL